MRQSILHLKSLVIACVLFLPAMASTSTDAHAEDLVADNVTDSDEITDIASVDFLYDIDGFAIDNWESARKSWLAGVKREIALPEPKPQLHAFIEECAELEAIPLIRLAEDRDRRWFVGISFDGYLGLHARL